MADYTYMGIVAPEWAKLEKDFPQWFNQSTPAHWTLEDIKNDINKRRAEEAEKAVAEYSMYLLNLGETNNGRQCFEDNTIGSYTRRRHD
jgi:hypothetical protein